MEAIPRVLVADTCRFYPTHPHNDDDVEVIMMMVKGGNDGC